MSFTEQEFEFFQKEFNTKKFGYFIDKILLDTNFSKLKVSRNFVHFLRNYMAKINIQDVLDFINFIRNEDKRLANEFSDLEEMLLGIEVISYSSMNNSIVCEEKVIQIKKMSSNKLLISECLLSLADVYCLNDKYTEAHSCYIEIIEITKNTKDREILTMNAVSFLNLSLLFESIRDEEKMFININKSGHLFNQLKDSPYYADFLMIKANILYNSKKINEDEALKLLEEAKNLINDTTDVGNIYIELYKLKYLLNKGEVKQVSKILNIFNKKISNYSDFIQQEIISFNSQYLYLKGDFKKFVSYVEENKGKVTTTSTIVERYFDVLKKYIKVQEESKNYEKAVEYFKVLIKMQEDTNKTENIVKLKMTDARNSIKKKTEELRYQKVYSHKIELLNEKLLNKNSELEYFAGMAAHDIKSPVRNINNVIKIISSEDNLSEDQLELMQTVETSSKRIYTLVEDLLIFSSSGKFPVCKTAQDLNDIFKTIKQNIFNLIESKSAQINIFSSLPSIMIHKSALLVLFQNLISNSIKFSRENSSPIINISSNIQEKLITICIEDNGKGISNKDQEKIFKPFSRLSSSSNIEGSGLGLATCQKIVNYYNGTISIKSKVGEGSTFTIKFPIK